MCVCVCVCVIFYISDEYYLISYTGSICKLHMY